MVTPLSTPGVYVQQLPSGTGPIVGAATGVTAFIGFMGSGPTNLPILCTTFGEFQASFGGLDEASETSYQVWQFFQNGGAVAWVSRMCAPGGKPPRGIDIAGDKTQKSGVYAFDTVVGPGGVSEVNLICAPDLRNMDPMDYETAAVAVVNYAAACRAFAILDPPKGNVTVQNAVTWAQTVAPTFGTGIINAAAYFPEPMIADPLGTQPRTSGASGTMAGVYAATDAREGVWTAPAGIMAPLAAVEQLAYVMNDTENGLLIPAGMNALRTFPVYGNVAWGDRTLGSPGTADWTYLSVRRLALYIEQSLAIGLQWVALEPNNAMLWTQIEEAVGAFMHGLFAQGALFGATAAEAYSVICDASTTTAQDIAAGVVNITVSFAPTHPAEFIVIMVQQTAAMPDAG